MVKTITVGDSYVCMYVKLSVQWCSCTGVNIGPSQSGISIMEGDRGVRNTSGDSRIVQAIGCIELTRGILERNVTVSVVTSSSPSSTGSYKTDIALFFPCSP